MTISDGHVVEFDYTLKDNDGNIIDTSEGRGALPYLHGKQNIVPGLEKELTGKSVGDKLTVKVSAEEGYGQKHPQMIQSVPKTEFQNIDTIEVGMNFQVADQNGSPLVVTVIEIKDEEIVLDGNHPLAGIELNFDVEIKSIREATEEEMAHGHLHAQGETCGE